MQPLVVGNWKMNGTLLESAELAGAILKGIRTMANDVQVVLAPPYTALAKVHQVMCRSRVELGGQNCHREEKGAFTGEVSPMMLRDAGCNYVILGHSERRHIFHETNDEIAAKVNSALQHKLRVILCVGETIEERDRGQTGRVINRQLRLGLKGVRKNDIGNVEIAYEPVWAIGTGRHASPVQVTQVHERIRRFLVTTFGSIRGKRVRILYGGSVNSDNAPALMAAGEVNGLLVGGASLKALSFLAVIRCCARQKG
jgi:triosephosphate isomerase